MHMRTLFNWLAPPLRPTERKILAAVEAKLDPARAQLFGAQAREINYVQRGLEGREVWLYVIHWSRGRRDPSLRLPMEGREWRLARIRLRSNETKWTATVHLADGHLASIEYDGQVPPTEVEDVTIDVEIFEPPSRPPRSSGTTPVLPAWLQSYATRFGITNIDPPLAAEDRDLIVARLDAQLPEDYLDFIVRCDGVQIGPLSIVGARELYETRTEDGQYIVIGQMNGNGALAVRRPGPMTIFVDYEDGSIREIANSLEAAVEYLMA